MLGININRFFPKQCDLKLFEDENGAMVWDPAPAGDPRYYEELSRLVPNYYHKDRLEYSYALPYLKDKSVVEIGCGAGWLAEKLNAIHYVGLETNTAAVMSARSRGLNIFDEDYRVYADRHPASCDVVCSFQVLEHIQDYASFFSSTYKLLKPGGLLVTAVPSEDSIAGLDTYLNLPPHHLTRWSQNSLSKVPVIFGFTFENLHIVPLEDIHFGMFWECLLNAGFHKGALDYSFWSKVRVKLVIRMLRIIGIKPYVPGFLNVPGHTILSVHRKPI